MQSFRFFFFGCCCYSLIGTL